MSEADSPKDIQELSRHRYEQALNAVEAHLRGDPLSEGTDVLNEMRIVRMVGCNRVPWWGMCVDPEDTSVTVGVMMRNAFEALGDDVHVNGEGPPPRHWFTKLYVRRWRTGRRQYLEWLDTLG